ncbi:unnamed protein product [Urochloa decumbens]|uniref:Uncharacterized protein n=1 Tax=Urochloa decumbens TaxID=240449 RepID=A0ABC9AJ99_9POAL
MGEEEEEAVQEAEGAGGARKRKRGVGDGGEEEVDAVAEAEGCGAAGDGGVYEKELLGEDGDDDGAGYEGIAEEAVAEVMRWLEAEISSPAAAAAPASSPGFVTINGNEESCGPSFSAAASTVMASVDTRACFPPPPPLPWPWPEPLPATSVAGMGMDMDMDADAAAAKKMDADDVEMDLGDADEEWLARLLTCGGPLLEGVL